jgi:hypothetical protein
MRRVMSRLLAASLLMVPVAGCKKDPPADAPAATADAGGTANAAPAEPAAPPAPAAAAATSEGGVAAFKELGEALKAAGTDCAKATAAMTEIGTRNKAAFEALRKAMEGGSEADQRTAMASMMGPMNDMGPTMQACQADEGFRKAMALIDGRDPNAAPPAAAMPAVDATPTGDAVVDAGLKAMSEIATALSAAGEDCDKAAAAMAPLGEKHGAAIAAMNKKMETLPEAEQMAMAQKMMGAMGPMMQVGMKCQNHEGFNKAMAAMGGGEEEAPAAPGEPAAPAAPAEPVAP